MSNAISLNRSRELTNIATDNDNHKKLVVSGLDEVSIQRYNENKTKLMKHFNITETEWNNYKWQIANRISNVETLSVILDLDEVEKEEINEISKKYRWGISPYYLCLIDKADKLDPLKMMGVPSCLENFDAGESDPMSEEFTNPAGSITRRYPDRLIINVTNVCPMFCRHCQRKRNIGEHDTHVEEARIAESIAYIKEHSEIRDVLITGGDPLTLSDAALESIIKRVREIKHVEIIRIGTRVPVNLPQRITDELVEMLKKYHPLFINLQFNHPREITPESKLACEKLANAGIPLGNQSVLLNGINNDKYVQMALYQNLLKIRVKPYYLFHAKDVKGTLHFNTSLQDGLEIIKYLRGNTSGLAIPAYILNAKNGLGKIPLLPDYVVSKEDKHLILRTWEGKQIEYEDDPTVDFQKMYTNRHNK